jgi:hypothetical protein
MKKIILTIIFSSIIIGVVFPQNTDKIKPPAPPQPPAEPIKPVVPGVQETPSFPRFPDPPVFPNRNNQINGTVSEVERYNLTVSGAFPNGNTGNNVANTIKNAEYILYSNRTIAIKILFNNGSEYIYHLRNPRSKIEIRTGVFRETFETIVQVDKEFLLEQYTSELSYDNNTITSLHLIGNNKIIVILNFSKKT